MIYLEALGRPLLIINDISIAQDLLEKRSTSYSSRYASPSACITASVFMLLQAQDNNAHWRVCGLLTLFKDSLPNKPL
jgi:hypothetical protein